MIQSEFELEFEVLNGYFNATPKKNTAKAWFRIMKDWDIDIFRKIVNGYADAMEDRQGKINFPHSGIITKAYKSLTGGIDDPEKIESCQFCLRGKVYLIDDCSRPFVFQCGDCKPWMFRKLEQICKIDLGSWLGKGWFVDPALKKKHDLIKEGLWKPEGNNMSKNQTKAILRGLGFGNKPDKSKEKMRQSALAKEEQEQGDMPF